MERTEIFKEELDYIKNPDIQTFAVAALNLLPEYFFSVAASSTGKYHPSYALGEGGLVRHTKAAMRFLKHITSIEQTTNQFTQDEIDCMLVALMLHDGIKHGTEGSKFTTFTHPLVAAEFVSKREELNNIISPEYRNLISECIASHMGQWNTDKRSSETLPKPQNKYQKLVHLCDYLASRKDIEVLFNNEITSKPTIDTYKVSFGKHKGLTLMEISEQDPDYITWAKENITREPIASLLKELK